MKYYVAQILEWSTFQLYEKHHQIQKTPAAVIRLFFLVRVPETYRASRVFTSAESPAHLSCACTVCSKIQTVFRARRGIDREGAMDSK